MYQIIKVLNNNAVLAIRNDVELILLGKGVGFKKKIDQKLIISEDYKEYVLKSTDHDINLDVIYQTDAIYLEISSNIIEKAKLEYKNFDDNILLPLADHISFSIQRIQNNIEIDNPFKDDIKLLFEKEYKIAETAYNDIKEKVGYEINEDEIGFIALHIHSAIVENATNVENLLRITNLLQIYISRIEKDRDVVILRNTIFYMRLLTHIKYLLLRIEKGEELDVSLNEFVNNSFAYSFEIAEEFCSEISKILSHKIDESEIGYLAIHIERITKDYKTANSD